MDIEELGMILSKNYDAIRDKNIEIENETAALERDKAAAGRYGSGNTKQYR